jgi:glycosyltransferase involved in cell wall biosynthesis
MKKVAIVGSVGLPAKYGGWETLVDQLTQKLSPTFDFTVYCSTKRYERKHAEINGAKLHYINLDANGWQSIFYDLLSILNAIKYADTILILGVSGCIFLPIIKTITRKRIIVNIDGLEWKRDKWGIFTKIFLKFSEFLAVKFADIVIADNKAIQCYLDDTYSCNSVMIAYGGDNAVKTLIGNEHLLNKKFEKRPYAFKVCRIEPENNIHLIINAFKDYHELDLIIVGNWDNSTYGKNLKKECIEFKHIHLLDPIYNLSRLNEIRMACHLYLHGHSAGGTNPSLVEAMCLGLPVIAYNCIFNKETTHNQALYFDSSAQLINILMNLTDDNLLHLKFALKKIAVENYSWEKITSEYSKIL